MSQDQLLTYIKTQLASGFTKDSIIQTLLSAGYQQTAIDQAFSVLSISPLNPSPVVPSVETFQPTVATTPTEIPVESENPAMSVPKSQGRFSKKRLLFILLPLLLLVLLGFIAWFVITTSPSYVLGQAYEHSKSIKTLTYNATVKASFSFSFPTFSPYTASSSSQLGYSDDFTQGKLAEPAKKSNFVLLMHIKGLSDFTPPQKHSYIGDISIGDGDLNSLGGGVEIRTIRDTLYLRIAKFPNFGLFDTASLTNQWIKFDDSSELTGNKEKKNKKLTSEQITKLQEMAKKAQIFSIVKTLPSETIANQSSYHYQIAINKKNLQTFFNDATVLLAADESEANYYKELKGYIEKTTFKKSELWITKKEKYVSRVLLEMTTNTPTNGDFSLSTDITMSDINKPVSIIAPLDAKPLKDIFPSSSLYSGYASDSASLSQPQAVPTPIIVPYGTVLGDKTHKGKQKETENQSLREQTPEEQLLYLLFLRTIEGKKL